MALTLDDKLKALTTTVSMSMQQNMEAMMTIQNPANRNTIAPPLTFGTTKIDSPYSDVAFLKKWNYTTGKTDQDKNLKTHTVETEAHEATILLNADDMLEDITGLASKMKIQAELATYTLGDGLENAVAEVLTGQTAILTADGKTFFASDHPFKYNGTTGAYSNTTISGTATATTPTFVLAFCSGTVAPMNACFTTYGAEENALYGGATQLLSKSAFSRLTSTDIKMFDNRQWRISVESKFTVGGFMPALAHKFVGKITTDNIILAMKNYAKQRLFNGFKLGVKPNTIIVNTEFEADVIEALKPLIKGGETNITNSLGLNIVTNNYMQAKA